MPYESEQRWKFKGKIRKSVERLYEMDVSANTYKRKRKNRNISGVALGSKSRGAGCQFTANCLEREEGRNNWT